MSILEVEMQPSKNDASAKSIGDYLLKLLETLWDEQEGFSGKRPFGNSGWEMELVAALINGGLLDGSLDRDGYVVDYNRVTFSRLMLEALAELRRRALG